MQNPTSDGPLACNHQQEAHVTFVLEKDSQVLCPEQTSHRDLTYLAEHIKHGTHVMTCRRDHRCNYSTSMKRTLMNMEMELQIYHEALYEILCTRRYAVFKQQSTAPLLLDSEIPESKDMVLEAVDWGSSVSRRDVLSARCWTKADGCVLHRRKHEKTYISLHPQIAWGCYATAIWSLWRCWLGLMWGGAGRSAQNLHTLWILRLSFYAAVIALASAFLRNSKHSKWQEVVLPCVTRECPAARRAVGCSNGVLLITSSEFSETYLITFDNYESLPANLWKHRIAFCSGTGFPVGNMSELAFNLLRKPPHTPWVCGFLGRRQNWQRISTLHGFQVFEPLEPNCCLTPQDGETRPGYAWKSDR